MRVYNRLEPATLPRKLSSSLRGGLPRAASATPGTISVARKLSLEHTGRDTGQSYGGSSAAPGSNPVAAIRHPSLQA